MITIIAAITAGKGAIGRGGDMLYHLREDLRRFKALTTGHTVVMGRKTFESLPKGALPNRRNIVITRNGNFSADGTERAGSLEEALAMCGGEDEVFVIGGGEIYAQALDKADKLELTLIEGAEPADADTFFPAIDPGEWELAEFGEPIADEKQGVVFRFATFRKAGFSGIQK